MRKTTLLIGFILIHILAIGCKCGKKNSNSLANEEKKLKNNLKEQCKAEGWKKLKETFEQDRSDRDNINQHIQRLLALQGEIDNIATLPKLMAQGKPTSEKSKLQSLIDFVSPLKACPEAIAYKSIDELVSNQGSLQQFGGLLSDSTVIPMIRTFLNNQLNLWRNLEKQLEQESTEGNSNSN